MTNRRGFLQKIAALWGSTLLPSSTVGGVIPPYSPQVAATAAAITATGVATVREVARKVLVSGFRLHESLDPMISIAILRGEKSGTSVFSADVLFSEISENPERRAEAEELGKMYPESHPHSILGMISTRIALEKEGLPPLTDE